MWKTDGAKRIKAVLLGLLIVCPIVLSRANPVTGTVNRERAVEVANGTLILGRHMIYLPKLTPQLVEIANASVDELDPSQSEDEQTGQKDIYYKSDVVLVENATEGVSRGGVWYRINSISDIAEISASEAGRGDPVSSNVIDQIYLMYHTKPDGKTYDLITGRVVDIFNLDDPYNINAMPEVENLRIKLETLQSDESLAKGRAAEIASLEAVLKVKITKTKEMTKQDSNLDAMQKLYEYTVGNSGSISEVSEIDNIRASEAAKRKIMILDYVETRVQAQSTFAAAPPPTQKSKDEEEDETADQAVQPYTELSTEYEVALQKIKESRDGSESKILTDSSSTFQHTIFIRSGEAVGAAISKDYAQGRSKIKVIVCINNVVKGNVLEKDEELAVIDDLQGGVLNQYKAFLQAGETQAYITAKQSKELPPVLDGIKILHMSEVTERQKEIMTLIEAKNLRLSNDTERLAFMDGLMPELIASKAGIKADDFGLDLTANVDELLNRMGDLVAQIKARLSGGTDYDKLSSQLDILRTEYQKALDSGDLATAGQMKTKMMALTNKADAATKAAMTEYLATQSKIKDLENERAKSGMQADSQAAKKLDAEIAGLKVAAQSAKLQMGAAGVQTLDDLNSKLDNAKEMIRGATTATNVSGVGTLIDDIANSPLGAGLKDAALKDLRNTIAEKKLEESYPAGLDDAYNKASAVIESGLSGVMDQSQTEFGISQKLDSLLSTENGLSDSEKQVLMLMALQEAYNKTGDLVYENLFSKILADARGCQNWMLVSKLKQVSEGETIICIPLDSVARLKKYQYIWSEDHDTAYLSGSKKQYRFKNGDEFAAVASTAKRDAVVTFEKEEMSGAAEFKSVMFVPNDFISESFGVKTGDLEKTSYAAIYNETDGAIIPRLVAAIMPD